jgi:hypothetical protein
MQAPVSRAKRTWLAFGGALVAASIAAPAAADKPFVDRALTLQPLHFSADAGIGFGQFEAFGVNPARPIPVAASRLVAVIPIAAGTDFALTRGSPCAFFGPLTGLVTGLTWASSPNPTITAGIGGGYTLAPFDFKAQIYTAEVERRLLGETHRGRNWGRLEGSVRLPALVSGSRRIYAFPTRG